MPLDLSTLTDKLSAVNVLLQAIAEAPVNTLDTSASVDVAAAIQTLDEIGLAVQMKGWHWNTEESLTLSPDGEGIVVLPDNTLSVAPVGTFFSGSEFKAGERNRQLYNRTDHTFTFAQPVIVDLVVALDWDELPIYAKRYIAIRATKQFQARLQGNSLIDRVTDWEVSDAHLSLEEAEDRANTQNQVSGNAQLVYRLWGRARRRP